MKSIWLSSSCCRACITRLDIVRNPKFQMSRRPKTALWMAAAFPACSAWMRSETAAATFRRVASCRASMCALCELTERAQASSKQNLAALNLSHVAASHWQSSKVISSVESSALNRAQVKGVALLYRELQLRALTPCQASFKRLYNGEIFCGFSGGLIPDLLCLTVGVCDDAPGRVWGRLLVLSIQNIQL